MMKQWLQQNQKTSYIAWWILAWCLVVFSSLLVRGFIPVDETRYVAVAWEMWYRDEWFLPTLNFEPYSHKPPLMFWLFQLGWAVFGVHDWWPRIVPALFALGTLFLTGSLALRLWPKNPSLYWQAPTILIGTLFWAAFTPAVMFDMILTFFVVLAIYGLVLASQQHRYGWWLFAMAMGFGILAKGPVMMLQFAFPALLAPLWVEDKSYFFYKKWLGCLFLFIVIGAIIPLLWAIPAAIKGGPAYTHEIFLSQTVDRVQKSFAHQRPFYWYLPALPVLLMPWLIWPCFWKKVVQLKRHTLDSGQRLTLIWLIPTFLCFCFISGKQTHYLLPLFPGFALFTARLLTQQSIFPRKNQAPIALVFMSIGVILIMVPIIAPFIHKIPSWLSEISPVWGVFPALIGLGLYFCKDLTEKNVYFILSATTIGLILVILFGIMYQSSVAYNIQPMARKISRIHKQGIPIVYVGSYHGQFQFLGKLKGKLPAIYDCKKALWASQNPDGYLIDTVMPDLIYNATPEFSQPYRGKQLVLWQSKQLLANDSNYPFPLCVKD